MVSAVDQPGTRGVVGLPSHPGKCGGSGIIGTVRYDMGMGIIGVGIVVHYYHQNRHIRGKVSMPTNNQ